MKSHFHGLARRWERRLLVFLVIVALTSFFIDLWTRDNAMLSIACRIQDERQIRLLFTGTWFYCSITQTLLGKDWHRHTWFRIDVGKAIPFPREGWFRGTLTPSSDEGSVILGMRKYWLVPGIGAGIIGIVWIIRRVRWRNRVRAGKCPVCRYDLRGNISGTCPECGYPYPDESRSQESRP